LALDRRIEETYAARSTATLKNSLYDSYIRAIRWASDRIAAEGVVCFVSNGGYIDSNTADGLRKTLADEFSTIYCFNLRGNQRTAGELSRREGGKIFGSGSRSTVAILLLVKSGRSSSGCQVLYRDIGDYLTRDQKLAIIDDNDLDTIDWQTIQPNAEGDWTNQRNAVFDSFRPLGSKPVKGQAPNPAIFKVYSGGLKTNRDSWVYDYSNEGVETHVRRVIDFYNSQIGAFSTYCQERGLVDPKEHVDSFIDRDSSKISWDRGTKIDLARAVKYEFKSNAVVLAAYCPFTKQYVYFDRKLNNTVYQLPQIFPASTYSNLGIHLTSAGSHYEFTPLMTDHLPDLHLLDTGQFFPLYTYRKTEVEADLFTDVNDADYMRVDNIADETLSDYRKTYGSSVHKDDIFYYVYGLLHSPIYRDKFAADLKKMLPRIPKVRDFKGFTRAGRELADLHVGYESVAPYQLDETVTAASGLSDASVYRVRKMTFGKGKATAKDRSRIIYNSHVTLSGIPEEAYRYALGPRSAIDWIVDQYQVKTDKASGIVNDPNEWSDDPRYILDLLKRIVTVSVESMKIIDSLPALDEL
jgi:predicted helicase